MVDTPARAPVWLNGLGPALAAGDVILHEKNVHAKAPSQIYTFVEGVFLSSSQEDME